MFLLFSSVCCVKKVDLIRVRNKHLRVRNKHLRVSNEHLKNFFLLLVLEIFASFVFFLIPLDFSSSFVFFFSLLCLVFCIIKK